MAEGREWLTLDMHYYHFVQQKAVGNVIIMEGRVGFPPQILDELIIQCHILCIFLPAAVYLREIQISLQGNKRMILAA